MLTRNTPLRSWLGITSYESALVLDAPSLLVPYTHLWGQPGPARHWGWWAARLYLYLSCFIIMEIEFANPVGTH